MERVTLFYEDQSEVKISREVFINEKGQLHFDGHDVGESVGWGSSEYEYKYSVESRELEKI